MPRGEKLTDAIRYEKVDALKNDLFFYIENHPDKITANIPVFYGHVMSALDNAFPDIDNSSYDNFIDAISFRIMKVCPEAKSVDFIEKVISNAIRCKKKKSGRATLRILSGVKMMDIGKFKEAIDYFNDYWKYDARIGMYISYCYYSMSINEKRIAGDKDDRPSRFELESREILLKMAEVRPSVNRFKQLDIKDTESMERAFWLMTKKALEWFHNERWFVKIGIEKAKNDGNQDKRVQLLKHATAQFYNDQDFLKENFYYHLENRDGAGAAGIVKQMIQQNPNSLHPYYYGMKLSLLSNSKSSYNDFRDKAFEKGMPSYLIQLFDLAIYIMRDEQHEADIQFKHIKKMYNSLNFYLIAIDYFMKDIFSEDGNSRKKIAKNAFFESLDKYAMQVIKIKE